MATTPGGFTVLPQFQSNLYDLQTKQALAQALIGQGLKGNLAAYQPAGGGHQYVPSYGIGGALGQLGSALAGGLLQRQASQDLSNLGQQQWAALTGQGLPQQQTGPDTQQLATALQGGGGPTNANAVSLGAVMSQPQASAQPAPLAPGGMLNPAGLPTNLAAQEYLRDPAKYTEQFVAPYFKPTESTMLGRQAGMNPQQIQEVNARRAAQMGYIAPVAGGPGQVYRDPLNPSKVVASNPMVGENQEVLYTAEGRPVIRTIPGAAESTQELARATAMGKAGAEPISGFDAAGNPVFTTKAAVVQGGAQGSAPATGRFAGYQAPGGVRPALSPAEQEGQIGLAKGNVGNYNVLKDTASNSAERTNILDTLEAYANGRTQFGPGWTGRIENLAAINSKLPSGLAFGSNEVSNAQVVQKLASNLIQQYQKSMGGTGTDKQFDLVMHGTPGADMTNKAMLEVIPKLKSMEVALQAKANAADSWLASNNNNPASLNKFETMWRQNYDPRIYQMSMMNPQQRAAFMSQQKDAAQLKTKVQTALNNGWVQ